MPTSKKNRHKSAAHFPLPSKRCVVKTTPIAKPGLLSKCAQRHGHQVFRPLVGKIEEILIDIMKPFKKIRNGIWFANSIQYWRKLVKCPHKSPCKSGKTNLVWDVWGANLQMTMWLWTNGANYRSVVATQDVYWLQANWVGHSQLSRAMGPLRHLDKMFLWALLTQRLECA